MLRTGKAQLIISAELGHAQGRVTAVYFGLAVTCCGDYSWMFIADVVLALLAVIVSLPVRKARWVAATA